MASAGRYGGTYAHKDIAFEFGSWLSPPKRAAMYHSSPVLQSPFNKLLTSIMKTTKAK
jgi:hypothetical protein